eukprot:g17676.t1
MPPLQRGALPPVVGFIDMDCFYVAVERARDPRLLGKPCAVVQYPTGQRGRPDLRPEDDRWRTGGPMGGIIAVSYEARARGVTRQMSGAEAKKVCPEVILVQVPTAFGKADLQIYKAPHVAIDITGAAEHLLASRAAAELGAAASAATHLADSALSVDAAKVTRSSARQGHDKQQSRDTSELADGWEEMIYMSAGLGCVATNKVLAKLGCGLHKPNQQTLLLPHAAPVLLKDLPLDRLPGLGGDFGQAVKSRFGVQSAGELLQVPRPDVLKQFPQRGEWLLALAAGDDSAAEAVKDRQLVKSLSNGKTFFGEKRLRSLEEVDYWLGELTGELHRRYLQQVEKHQRTPRTPEQILQTAKACARRAGAVSGVISLGLSLSNMIPLEASSASLSKFFGRKSEGAASKEKGEKPQEKAKAKPKEANLLGACFARAAAAQRASSDQQKAPEVDEGVLAELPLNIQQDTRTESVEERGAMDATATELDFEAFEEISYDHLIESLNVEQKAQSRLAKELAQACDMRQELEYLLKSPDASAAEDLPVKVEGAVHAGQRELADGASPAAAEAALSGGRREAAGQPVRATEALCLCRGDVNDRGSLAL